jgi:hypothetical protein
MRLANAVLSQILAYGNVPRRRMVEGGRNGG